MSNIIDRYTKIDDLLKTTINTLNELIKQQQFTNSLLYELLKTERTQNLLVGGTPQTSLPQQNINVDVGSLQGLTSIGGNRYKTTAKTQYNIAINPELTLYEENHGGALQELVLLASDGAAANAIFKLQILADGEKVYDDSYTNLASLSDYESDMTAFDDGTYYVVAINTVFFEESIKIWVYESTATFDYIYMKIVKRL